MLMKLCFLFSASAEKKTGGSGQNDMDFIRG